MHALLKGSIEERRLWFRSYFFSSVPYVCLIYMALEIGGRCLYEYCLVGCCFPASFNIAWEILMSFPSSFFSKRLVSVHGVHPYGRIDMTTAWKKLHFILSEKFDFHMIDNLSIPVHAFVICILISSVDVKQLLRCAKLSTSFRAPPNSVEMSPFGLKYMYSVFSGLTWSPMPPATCSRLCSRDSAWVCAFNRNALSSV